MEDIIELISSEGFRINNLFQLDETYWRCNLRDSSGGFFDFGVGKTPKEALVDALSRADKKPVAKQAEDFSDILG